MFGLGAAAKSPPPPAALSLQDELMEKLKDCLVVSVSQDYSTDGLRAVRIEAQIINRGQGARIDFACKGLL